MVSLCQAEFVPSFPPTLATMFEALIASSTMMDDIEGMEGSLHVSAAPADTAEDFSPSKPAASSLVAKSAAATRSRSECAQDRVSVTSPPFAIAKDSPSSPSITTTGTKPWCSPFFSGSGSVPPPLVSNSCAPLPSSGSTMAGGSSLLSMLGSPNSLRGEESKRTESERQDGIRQNSNGGCTDAWCEICKVKPAKRALALKVSDRGYRRLCCDKCLTNVLTRVQSSDVLCSIAILPLGRCTCTETNDILCPHCNAKAKGPDRPRSASVCECSRFMPLTLRLCNETTSRSPLSLTLRACSLITYLRITVLACIGKPFAAQILSSGTGPHS